MHFSVMDAIDGSTDYAVKQVRFFSVSYIFLIVSLHIKVAILRFKLL